MAKKKIEKLNDADLDKVEGGILIGLLLPAVQKDEQPIDDISTGTGDTDTSRTRG